MFPIEYAPLVALAVFLAIAAVVGLVRYVFGAWANDFLDRYERIDLKRKAQYLVCLRELDSCGHHVKGLVKGRLYRLVAKQPDDQIRIELAPGQHLICPSAWFESVRISSKAVAALD